MIFQPKGKIFIFNIKPESINDIFKAICVIYLLQYLKNNLGDTHLNESKTSFLPSKS